jgi:hypothetical protein
VGKKKKEKKRKKKGENSTAHAGPEQNGDNCLLGTVLIARKQVDPHFLSSRALVLEKKTRSTKTKQKQNKPCPAPRRARKILERQAMAVGSLDV